MKEKFTQNDFEREISFKDPITGKTHQGIVICVYEFEREYALVLCSEKCITVHVDQLA